MPFENAEYLIRCVNSLYRQLGENFEIILAENELDENAVQFIAEKSDVKRISDAPKTVNEKISEASELLSEDCGYVILLDVNTVVAPICSKAILACEQNDLIIPAVALRKGNDFIVEISDKIAMWQKFDQYVPQRFCFGRGLFDDFITKYTENNELFPAFLFSILVEKLDISYTKDVCMYTEVFELTPDENINFEMLKEQCDTVLLKLFDIQDIQTQILIFEKLINKISYFLGDENLENCQKAFGLLQRFFMTVKDDFLFRSFIETKIGFKTDDFMILSYDEYVAYKLHVTGINKIVAPIDITAQEKLLKDMKVLLDETKGEIADLKKSVVLFKSNYYSPTQNSSLYKDPVVDVPKLYYEGRLGLKTIWQSFCGWIRFKLVGKK